jgi:hypothetical protein
MIEGLNFKLIVSLLLNQMKTYFLFEPILLNANL